MKAGSCRPSGSELTVLPNQDFAYDFLNQVNDVGRPAAIFSRRLTVIRK